MNGKKMIKWFLALSLCILAGCGQNSGTAPGLTDSNSEGDGGGGGGGNTPTACNPCKIFGTASGNFMQGDFGYYGIISKADATCATDSNNPQDGSTYKALFIAGVRTTTNDWVLHPDTSYQRVDGTPIGVTNSSAWLDTTSMTNSITGTTDYYWTGIKSGWVDNTSADCDGWGDGTSGKMGMAGRGNSTTFTAVGGAAKACDNSYGFYCVQQ